MHASEYSTKTIKTRGFKQYRGNATYYRAVTFFVVMMVITLYCLTSIYNSSDPVIIGTELNGNGEIEYMCLGNSCETLNKFTWDDSQ